MQRRPPLPLAAAAVAAGWAALYSVVRWTLLFAAAPEHDDTRMWYVAAEAGLRYGWSTIYDQATLRQLSQTLPEATRFINTQSTFSSAPLLPWVFAPLTIFPLEVAYVIWTLLSLVALVVAWRIAAPYAGLAKFTLLLLAIGLWPVMLTLYFGQPTLFTIACVAAAWWLCKQDRPFVAGLLLAFATFLKPQPVVFLPIALFVSGRFRLAGAWAIGCAILGGLTIVSLGPAGLAAWWQAVRGVHGLPINTVFTLAGSLGDGPLTYLLWVVQGGVALFIAWRRRSELEVVFAAGILGTVATATYLHNSEYCVLVLAAWLVLRTSPPVWHRAWLLAGVIPMQLLLTPLNAGPQLIWDAGWLAILAVEAVPALHAKAVASKVVVTARMTDQAPRRVGL